MMLSTIVGGCVSATETHPLPPVQQIQTQLGWTEREPGQEQHVEVKAATTTLINWTLRIEYADGQSDVLTASDGGGHTFSWQIPPVAAAGQVQYRIVGQDICGCSSIRQFGPVEGQFMIVPHGTSRR